MAPVRRTTNAVQSTAGNAIPAHADLIWMILQRQSKICWHQWDPVVHGITEFDHDQSFRICVGETHEQRFLVAIVVLALKPEEARVAFQLHPNFSRCERQYVSRRREAKFAVREVPCKTTTQPMRRCARLNYESQPGLRIVRFLTSVAEKAAVLD